MNIDLFKLFPHLKEVFEEEVVKEIEKIKERWIYDMHQHNKKREDILKALEKHLRRSEKLMCYTLDLRDISDSKVLYDFFNPVEGQHGNQ